MPKIADLNMDEKKEEILVGARRCFAAYGYEGATVRRLEEATGKSRGAIFHHFRDKETLFLALAQEDAARQADLVAREGLVEVMRDMLTHPERHEWLATRLEITKLLRTDPVFRARWMEHQEVLDTAVRQRLERLAEDGRMRDDVDPSVIHLFLETLMDGFITRLASGGSTEGLDRVLDLAESTVRSAPVA
ncbi:TetR/AcrR family transcriptional regulator [Corynebacterium anserum]|uniref:TetR family transcriptional regulator n=1 Tax=Corynebacterium anserum TaxID=2684406 RepID=A0A7G7YND8_9CORY|nr:TetR/AcrR family transcriptional regulator [Corynebacterium anserum]QNH96008.1 TetR family transcriptional regulator [Corynebacterium anserum]